jgi:FixJ family two-component response regulator
MIAVIDDDPSVRRALLRLLRAAGYAAEAFASAAQYLDAAVTTLPACLVLDVRLAGSTGFDLADRLRAAPPPPPIVFITAHDDAPTRERARRAGAAGYLAKPFEGQALLDVVHRIAGPA